MKTEKITVSHFLKAKAEGEKIAMLTAYDYSTAMLMDEAGVDSLLVGDSLGMVMLGYENTLQVTMDDMIHHTKAVARGSKRALVVADMPFLSYHISVEESVRNAGRFIQAGATAVKLEGARNVLPHIEAILAAQIPVIGHLGLTPQSVHMMGGFKVQGKSEEAAKKLIEDALLLEKTGVFAIVLECVPAPLASLISKKLSIPTIGIGAGAGCDGQVLVYQDMMGMYEALKPKFVKTYAHMGQAIKDAVADYAREVKAGQFPEEKHTFKMEDGLIDKLY